MSCQLQGTELKMNRNYRIILPLVVFAFVQLINGQFPSQACIDATTALATNISCTSADAASVLCRMGTCRDLFNVIINNCDAAVSL